MTEAAEVGSHLASINSQLTKGWEARLTNPGNRLYYVSHHTQTSQWAPPQDTWKQSSGNGLPYGWEAAVDNNGHKYYINHVEHSTSRDTPNDTGEEEEDDSEPPQPRLVELQRDAQMGFGFVAGSEKPVIVRFVTEGGPSENKLLPGDKIMRINDEDVEKSPREHVIELVRACQHSISLTICQPHIDNSSRKSAILTAAKKAKLKSNPIRVRFAESVTVNGASVISPSTHESYIPFMPNVLKVFLENGQTKSFKYDNKTTVKDVVNSLQEKLNLTCLSYFSLVLQNMKSLSHGKISFLNEQEALADIAARPESQHFKCLFRVALVPRDPRNLLQKDEAAFEYFYMQCCNDVIQERFASEMKYDVALQLAALHIQQHVITNKLPGKFSLKNLEKETGLEKFIPLSLLETIKRKDLRKMLNHYMKLNSQQLCGPGQKQLRPIQAKIHYLKILSELRTFGGKVFVATFLERESMIIVGPKYAVSLITNIKNNILDTLANYEQLDYIVVTSEGDSMQSVKLHLKDSDLPEVSLSMLTDDVHDFLALVEGYYRLFVDEHRNLLRTDENKNQSEEDVPSYHGTHRVVTASWNYVNGTTVSPAEGASDQESAGSSTGNEEEQENEEALNERNKSERVVDLSQGPPPYTEKPQLIENLAETQHLQHAKVEEGKTLIAPPTNGPNVSSTPDVKVCDTVVKRNSAPLASPDVSTISGSSDSSITQSEYASELSGSQADDEVSRRLSQRLDDEDGDGSADTVSVDESSQEQMRDSDSLATCSSISTVISRTSGGSHGEGSPLADGPMRRSLSGQDTRFGVSSLKTFASSPPRTPPSNSPKKQRSMGRDTVASLPPANDLETAKVHDQGHNEKEQETQESGEAVVKDAECPTPGDDVENVQKDELNASLASGDQAMGSESDDTDSVSTPTDSPAHVRLESVNLRPPTLFKKDTERPQSFGLVSPEQLPTTESQFEKLACSFGLHSPEGVPQEFLHPSYNPRLFSDGALYLDPDIIDLTLIPPPKTPDQEQLIDFSSPVLSMTTPPPGFTDDSPKNDASYPKRPHSTEVPDAEGHLPVDLMDLPAPIREKIDALVMNDEELGNQLAAIDAYLIGDLMRADADNGKESGIESESDSGNETICSENVDGSGYSMAFQDFLASSTPKADSKPGVTSAGSLNSTMSFEGQDIDEFIASMTVPPPPEGSPPRENGTSRMLPASPPLSFPPRESEGSEVVSVVDDGSNLQPSRQDKESETNVGTLTENEPLSKDGSHRSWESLIGDIVFPHDGVLEEEYAKYVIPPPPDSSVEECEDIPIVPPVELKTPSPQNENADFVSGDTLLASIVASPGLEHSYVDELASGQATHQRSMSVPVDEAVVEKPRPKVPPKRFLSHESPSDSATTLPISSMFLLGGINSDVDGMDSGIGGHSPRTPLWRPTEISKSAESSPMHRAEQYYAHSRVHNSIGTLPRLGRGKKAAPPPPPRRSSMQSLGSGDGMESPPSASTLWPGGPIDNRHNYENVFEPQKPGSESDASKGMTSRGGSSVSLSQEAMARAQAELDDPRRAVTSSSYKAATIERDSHLSLDAVMEFAHSGETLPFMPLDHRRTSSSSSSESGKGNSDSRFQAFKSKLKAYVSPSIHKKQMMFSKSGGKNSNGARSASPDSDLAIKKSEYLKNAAASGSSSPKVGRSNTFTNSGIKPPRMSPHNSPAVNRHSSFTDGVAPDASPRTFRTFIGTKSVSSSSDSANASPVRTAGIRTGVPLASKAPGSQPSSESPKKTVPLKVVRPMVPTATSNAQTQSADGTPATSTSTNHKPATSSQSANHIDSSRSHDSGRKTPPWRSNSCGGSPEMLTFGRRSRSSSTSSNGTGSPRMGMRRMDDCRSETATSSSTTDGDKGDILEEVMNKKFEGEAACQEAMSDVDRLLSVVKVNTERLLTRDIKGNPGDFAGTKDTLLAVSRQFVTDSKLLVSSATHSKQKLVHNVNQSIHTLAKIVSNANVMVSALTAKPSSVSLLTKVKDVCVAYKATVSAAQQAAGKALSDPNMKTLMRQATSLAAVLSTFMKTLKVLENT